MFLKIFDNLIEVHTASAPRRLQSELTAVRISDTEFVHIRSGRRFLTRYLIHVKERFKIKAPEVQPTIRRVSPAVMPWLQLSCHVTKLHNTTVSDTGRGISNLVVVQCVHGKS
jgi:hypothetical protein